jgi:hypothetical protein
VSQILVYDAAPRDLRQRERRLAKPAELLGWPVRGFTSRNRLLSATSRLPPRTGSGETPISLIDLASNDGDLRLSGFECIDVMARHPSLRRQSQRAVLTRYFDQEVVEHAHALGAHAVIELQWLEQTTPALIASALRSLAARPTTPSGVVLTATETIPGAEALLEPLRVAFEQAKQGRVIGTGVRWNGLTTLEALIAIAEDVPADLVVDHVRAHHKALRETIQPSPYRGGKHLVAQQFLIRFAPPLPREIQLNWLPRLPDAQAWIRENAIRDATWLLDSDRSLLVALLTTRAMPEPQNSRQAGEAFDGLVARAVEHVRGDPAQPLHDASEGEMNRHLRRLLYTLKLTALDAAGI